MKKKLLKIFLIGFFVGISFLLVTRSFITPSYNNDQTLNALYNYIPLIENLDFIFLEIVKGKIYYTSQDPAGIVIDYIQQGKYADKVHETPIPPNIQEKTKHLKVYWVEKKDDLIYFTLGVSMDNKFGVFYSKKPSLDCKSPLPKEVRGFGRWYDFSTY